MAYKVETVKKGTIRFRWKDKKAVGLSCNVTNGEVIDHDAISLTGMGTIQSIRVEIAEGEEYDLCLECRTHLIKPRMNDVDGTNLEETLECSNPECNSKV